MYSVRLNSRPFNRPFNAVQYILSVRLRFCDLSRHEIIKQRCVSRFLLGSDENPDSTAKDANDNSTTTAPTTTTPEATINTPSANSSDAASAAAISAADSSGASRRSVLETLLKLPGVQQVVQTVNPLWRSAVERLKASPRHVSCPHAYGCLHYVLKVRQTGGVWIHSAGVYGLRVVQ